ncbi:MAG: hypothetical protein KKD38_01580, partial [Candidatus Delongbacteria bacterium]|nr:hypothetical protein [Candidatus Delongbacteria bacterium]MCG2760129.1 hypothetical protein [Candidatus Delongbacteria bacterium]
KPDILITDINFGGSDNEYDPDLIIAGVSLARRIKKQLPSVKIIAVSGYRNNDSVFEKIIEKDWFDYFHTKGSSDLYEKYSKLRNDVIYEKTGLINYLSKFFSPLNFNGDVNKSVYRILDTDYDRNENLIYLPDILNYYNSFRKMLDRENSEFLDGYFKIYRERDFTDKEKRDIKNRFCFKTNSFDCLYDNIRTTLYLERNLINEILNKIISETKDHCDINKAVFNIELTENHVVFSIRQNSEFDFDKFTESGRTMSVYKKIKNYGDIIIQSGSLILSVKSETVSPSDEIIQGSIIKMTLKISTP